MGNERMVGKIVEESKIMWHVAAPAILTGILQFSIALVTGVFVGHLGTVEFAAVSVVDNVIAGFAYGLLLGMGSALETLCGQAVGAGQIQMLGVYMQRSWIICVVTAFALLPVYIFTSPILNLFHQSKEISRVAGRFALWSIPQLFGYAFNFPIQKFYQSQSRVWVMTVIAAVALGIHALLNWVFVTKLGYGLLGAAMVGNFTWWFINLAQFVYLISGFFPEAWTGFSLEAFQNLGAFLKLSLASAIMLCLELWYFTAVIILVGLLSNPEIQVGAISICMNYQLWTLMIALGFNVAVSVRVSNELGANHPKAAKCAVIVAVSTSAVIGLVFMIIVLIANKQLAKFFTDDPILTKEARKLSHLLAATIFLNSVQPVLSGVAIGAGWQGLVAVINIACYYLIGLPLGAVFGFKLKLNALVRPISNITCSPVRNPVTFTDCSMLIVLQGIWVGMLVGTVLQTVVLFIVTFRTKWQREAMLAEERIRTWGGHTDRPSLQQTG